MAFENYKTTDPYILYSMLKFSPSNTALYT